MGSYSLEHPLTGGYRDDAGPRTQCTWTPVQTDYGTHGTGQDVAAELQDLGDPATSTTRIVQPEDCCATSATRMRGELPMLDACELHASRRQHNYKVAFRTLYTSDDVVNRPVTT